MAMDMDPHMLNFPQLHSLGVDQAPPSGDLFPNSNTTSGANFMGYGSVNSMTNLQSRYDKLVDDYHSLSDESRALYRDKIALGDKVTELTKQMAEMAKEMEQIKGENQGKRLWIPSSRYVDFAEVLQD